MTAPTDPAAPSPAARLAPTVRESRDRWVYRRVFVFAFTAVAWAAFAALAFGGFGGPLAGSALDWTGWLLALALLVYVSGAVLDDLVSRWIDRGRGR
ncbi:MAG: hypothetical protein IM628_02530 [Phenylobacterium sp.]|uniref:hypothetical protein n=1 Tax=Phenylobacterium sp. TaxID=1871053 RepID=UPI0025F959D4|nr:hypothetical protein [Phenylobacterium sp.]MCA6303683.1 hypothetical protein [Phenylobacterium sp.]